MVFIQKENVLDEIIILRKMIIFVDKFTWFKEKQLTTLFYLQNKRTKNKSLVITGWLHSG